MTQSGSPQGDEAGLEQEGIWEDAQAVTSTPGPPQGLTESITSTARVPGPPGLYFADVPNRIMALIIDIIVLSVVGSVLAWLFGGLVSEPGALDSAGGELDIVAFVVVLVLQLAISFGYFGVLWVLVSATAGMRLLGLRVGDESDGRPISWRQALIRWLILGIPTLLVSLVIYVPNTIGMILAALGLAWMLLLLYTIAQSPTKQGLHDRFGHTIVVKVRRRAT